MDDTMSVGKFCIKFLLWFLIINLLGGIVFGLLGNVVLLESDSLWMSGSINIIISAIVAVFSCFLATKLTVKDARIEEKHINSLTIFVAILFITIVAISSIGTYKNINDKYKESADTAINKAMMNYDEMTEEDKARFDKQKEEVLEKTQKTIQTYSIVLIVANSIIYIGSIFFERKLLQNKAI